MLPATGPMYRVETRDLDDPGIGGEARRQRVAVFADTPSTGGTATDADGSISSSDTEHLRILNITPDGAVSTLLASPKRDRGRRQVDRRRRRRS